MKNLFSPFCFLITGTAIFGQTTTDSLLRNELGVSLMPIIKIAEGSQDRFTYSTHYKRAIGRNLFARLETIYTKAYHRNTFATGVYSKDSASVYCDYYRYSHRPTLQFNFGLEYRWGRQNLRNFAGADVGFRQAGYDRNRYYTERYPGEWLEGNPQSGSEFSGIGYRSSDSLVSKNIQRQNATLLNLFYGVQFHFSRRFFFSAQLGALFSLKKTTIHFFNSSERKSETIQEFVFNPSLLQNFSLCYRF